jgi:hypothetical protein
MIKKIVFTLTFMQFIFAATIHISAQSVLMNSAETIKPGNFKLGIFPIVLFGKYGSDSISGVAGRAGFALTSSFDIEANAAFFDNMNYFGADGEYWLVRKNTLNVSVALGIHLNNVKWGQDSSGFDTALLISSAPKNKLEVYAGLKLAFDSLKNQNYTYTLAHIVPGIEYKINSDVDFLIETGLALNGRSRSYASAGLAFYL